MKKTSLVLALIFAALALLPGIAAAEALPAEPDPGVIPWDASKEEILALFGMTGQEENTDRSDAITYFHAAVPVLQYSLDFNAVYVDNNLFYLGGGFISDGSEDPSEILKNVNAELIRRFGEPNSENYDLMARIFEYNSIPIHDPRGDEADERYMWELPDGRTVIYTAVDRGAGVVFLDREGVS